MQLQLRLLRACRYSIALAERRFAAVSPEATYCTIAQPAGSCPAAYRRAAVPASRRMPGAIAREGNCPATLHGRLMQQSSFQALGHVPSFARPRSNACTARCKNASSRLAAAVEALSDCVLLQLPSHRCRSSAPDHRSPSVAQHSRDHNRHRTLHMRNARHSMGDWLRFRRSLFSNAATALHSQRPAN